MYMQCMQRPEDGIGSLETGVTDSCKLPCLCSELNPGSLQEQQVLINTEPLLQPLIMLNTLMLNDSTNFSSILLYKIETSSYKKFCLLHPLFYKAITP